MNSELGLKETIIINARLVLPEAELNQAALGLKNGIITAIYSSEQAMIQAEEARRRNSLVLDFNGDIIIPGLIDLHVHGCGGADTMDADASALDKMAVALFHQGTTAFLATTMTAPGSLIQKTFTAAEHFFSEPGKAELLGFHMEGPCISATFKGAQKIEIQETIPVPISPLVKIITLAPELVESKRYIKLAEMAGIILSVGHSGASFEQMQDAIEQGIHHVTHAFNVMPGIHHREPGLLTAALLDFRVTLELIADGVHIHPAVLELAIRLKTTDKIILVSDGTRAVGLPEGEYELGGQLVRLAKGRVSLGDGTIAGSALPLLASIRLVAGIVGRPLHETVKMATLNPARLLKLDHRIGSIAVGREATFLRLSADLAVKQVWQQGRLVLDYAQGHRCIDK